MDFKKKIDTDVEDLEEMLKKINVNDNLEFEKTKEFQNLLKEENREFNLFKFYLIATRARINVEKKTMILLESQNNYKQINLEQLTQNNDQKKINYKIWEIKHEMNTINENI